MIPEHLDPWEEVLDKRLALLYEAAESNHPFKSRLAKMALSKIGHEYGSWMVTAPPDEDALMALQRASSESSKEIDQMLEGATHD